MTQEIIEMAEQAGFDISKPNRIIVRHSNGSWISIKFELEEFAKLVAAKERADEREACALQLDASANQIRSRLGGLTDEDHLCIGVLVYEAKQIRARGES